MLERIGSSDAIRYMVQDCGMTLADASIKTGKQKGSLSTRLHNNTRFTIDEFVKICDACGWQLVLKRGNKQFDLNPLLPVIASVRMGSFEFVAIPAVT